MVDSETICVHVHLCTAGAHASRVTAVIQIHQWHMHVINKKGFGDDGHVVWAFVWALLTS